MKTILYKILSATAVICLSAFLYAPASAALPLQPEQIAVTCFSGTLSYNTSQVFPNLTTNGFVVAIFDTRTGNIGPLIPPPTSPPYLWNGLSTPPFSGYHNEPGQRWNSTNIGEVFGITVDDAASPNIYVTATDCYNAGAATTRLPAGPGGRGGVYRLDGTTGAIASGSLPNDPLQGPGLGNVCYRRAGSGTGYLYVSDLENGMIYRMNPATLTVVGSPFDHGVQGRPNESLAVIADNGTAGLTQYGRRIWGVKTYQNRLFYGVWWEDSRNVNAGESNEVWSVDLDNNGDFIASTARRRVTLPNYPDTSIGFWSHPVASIDFSESGKMFLAERYWQFIPPAPNATFGSHHDRIHRYWLSGPTWVTDPSPTHLIGGSVSFYFPYNTQVGGSSAGGVAVNCDESIWATGDMFAGSYSTPPNYIGGPGDLGAVYGAMRIPSGGNSALPGYGYGGFAIDFDGQTNAYTQVNKFAIGSVTTVRSCCVPAPSGLAAWWPLDEFNGATTFTDLSANANNAVIQAGALGSAQSPSATLGKVAGAASFIDSNTRGRAPNSATLNFGTGSLSMDCWIRPILSGTPYWKTIVDKFDAGTVRGYTFGISNGNVVLRVGDGAPYTYTGPSVVYSVWNFVAVTVDRTANQVTFNVNGVSSAPQTLIPSGSFNNAIDLLIGAPYAPNVISETALDEIELFNRALTTNELISIWASDKNGKCKSAQNQACSHSIVSIICPPNTNVSCVPIVYYSAPQATTTCGAVTNVVCVPPSGSAFPTGPTVVNCTATDAQGNSASCSFTVTALADTTPPVIDCVCLANTAQEILTTLGCKGTVPNLCQFYPCFHDNCCLKLCAQTPPAGTIVGPGTTPIKVTITDCAGNSNSCVLNYNVSPPSTGCETPCIYCPPMNIAVTGCPPRMPDFSTNNFAGPNCAPVGPLFVMQSPAAGTILAPGQTTVVMQVCDGLGTCTFCAAVVTAVPSGGNPMLVCPPNQVLQTCSNSATGYYKIKVSGQNGPVVCSPPSGTIFPLGTTIVTCTATNICGGSSTCSFTITVRQPITRWPCAYYTGIGIPFSMLGGATMAIRPDIDAVISDGTLATIPINPAICIFPNPNIPITPSGIQFHPGSAQAMSFTTVLDFEAVEGTGMDVALPPDPRNTNGMPYLSFRSKGKKGYCVKTAKLYDDEADIAYRSPCVNTNGELLPSLLWSARDIETNILLNLTHVEGVTSVVMTVTLDLASRQVSLAFPYCIFSPGAEGRKGWDGCIYGNGTPSKGLGTNKTAKLFIVPNTPHTPLPPVADVSFCVSGPEVLVEDAVLTAAGRKWGDGHVTLMKAYDDGEAGVEFTALAPGGGVHVVLGHAASFDLRLTHFENGDIPTEEQFLTRTIGPIALTNRPSPPPFLDALLLQATSSGVDCSADFSNIDSPTVLIQIYNAGALVAERAGVSAQLGQTLFTMQNWPNHLGKLSGASPCRRGKMPAGFVILPGAAGLPPQSVVGDEFRVLAELPPGVPHPDYYSSFEFLTSAGADWGVTALSRVSICVPEPVAITRNASGVSITWAGDNFRLQGAENVTGPWFDLGVGSPALLPANTTARFLRLNCD